MKRNIQSVRGMHSYSYPITNYYEIIENKLKNILISYGYSEIRLPILEYTKLFQRAIGNNFITNKEMYTFLNKKGNSLSMRPEGTAGCVRASIEQNLLYNKKQRLWYLGPMFRYERPQKGRYRQFHQIGAEIFGQLSPDADAELIMIISRYWKELGINDLLSLELNSIGSYNDRLKYSKALTEFLSKNISKISTNYHKRIYTDPIKILDSKNPNIIKILKYAPKIDKYIDSSSISHFNKLCKILDFAGIKYEINLNLVRGLDYYNRTVFEWYVKNNSYKGAICGGGRYDNLVENLGGKSTPAVGFSIGLDRLLLAMKINNINIDIDKMIDIFLMSIGDFEIKINSLLFAEKIHNNLPTVKLMVGHGKYNYRNYINQANKYGASIALLLSDKEVLLKRVTIIFLRKNIKKSVAQSDLIDILKKFFNND